MTNHLQCDSRWYKNTPSDRKKTRAAEIASFRPAFEALKELLEKELEESTPDYSCPSWSHKQADVNGANRKLREVLKLISF